MVELLRHRQTKGAATDMFYLTPPRHISTLPIATESGPTDHFRSAPRNGHRQTGPFGPVRAMKRLMQSGKTSASFDHLIGAREQGRREFKAHCSRR